MADYEPLTNDRAKALERATDAYLRLQATRGFHPKQVLDHLLAALAVDTYERGGWETSVVLDEDEGAWTYTVGLDEEWRP